MTSDDSSFMGRTSVNIVFNVTRTVVMALIGLLLVPYYLDQFGRATYGVIPLATTMTSYVMIICDSLTSATTRYSILALREGNDEKSLRVFNTAFFGIGRVCLLVVPVIIVLSVLSPYIFSIPEGSETDVQLLFLGVLSASLIVALASSFECVFQAYNRLYMIYLIKTVYVVLQVLIIFAMFSTFTPTLAQVGLSYILSAFVLFVLFYMYARKNYPALRLRFRIYSGALFREMGVLGFWSIVERVGGLLYIQISLVLTNIYLGSDVEAGFSIVSSMVSMVHTACYSVTSALTPIIYKCYADQEIDNLIALSKAGLKIVSLMFAFPVALLIVFAPDILTTWVGAENAGLADLLRVAFIGDILYCAISVINGIPTVYLKVTHVAIITVVFGVVNTVGALFSLFFTDWGVVGVMWIWVFAVSAQAVYLAAYVARIVGSKIRMFMAPIAYGYVVCAILSALLYGLSNIIEVHTTWLYMIPFCIILFVIYLVPMYFVLMSHDDRSMVLNALPGSVVRKLPKFMTR